MAGGRLSRAVVHSVITASVSRFVYVVVSAELCQLDSEAAYALDRATIFTAVCRPVELARAVPRSDRQSGSLTVRLTRAVIDGAAAVENPRHHHRLTISLALYLGT